MGQVRFVIFDLLVMVKGPFGQSIFFFNLIELIFFFFQGVRIQVKFPGRSESDLDKRVRPMEDDVIGDVTLSFRCVQRACRVAGTCRRVKLRL